MKLFKVISPNNWATDIISIVRSVSVSLLKHFYQLSAIKTRKKLKPTSDAKESVALDDSNDVAVVAGRRKSPTKGRTLGKKMEQSSKYE